MRLPYLKSANQESMKQIGQFGGLNKGETISENEFSDMMNMSSDQYPGICTRRARGFTLKRLEKPRGMFYKNGLVFVDGTKLWYKESALADVSDTDKIMVGMGAYVIVFPDKIMLNTSTNEVTMMEVGWGQNGTATFAQTTTGSTLTKITCSGIGKKFNQFDAVTISGCTDGSFNKTATIQEKSDDYIVVIGNTAGFTQGSGLQIRRKVPDMDFVCESENRLWGCSNKNHEIYASKLGDPQNWNAFEGISTDSYAVTVGSDGDFTGCIAHLGYVLFFKEDTIHKIFGNKPGNYQVTTSSPVRGLAKGCEKTLTIVNETLIYASRDDICSFDGAQPEAIGVALRPLKFTAGVAGHYNGKYYASLQDESGVWGMYVYDIEKHLWHKEDDLHTLYMTYGNGDLYCLSDRGEIFTIVGNRKETIPWRLETGDLVEGSVTYKYIRRVIIGLNVEDGAEVNVLIQYDGSPEWKSLVSFRGKNYRFHDVNLIPGRCQRYRLRLEGVGAVSLVAMGKVIGAGSEIRGSL